MGYTLSSGIFAGLAVAGIGSGIYLGQAAIAEIDPIYFQKPPTRFHADLSPNRPSDSAPRPMLAATGGLSLGTGCVGCRTYPEELYPVPSAQLRGDAASYAEEAKPIEVEEVERAPDPEADRLRRDVERVAVYARSEADEFSYASAETPAEPEAEPISLTSAE